MKPQVLISFDVEEFDMPLDYQYNISIEQQLNLGKEGLDTVMPLIDTHAITTTLFTTANFANHFPESIRKHAVNHEIASHTFYHSHFTNQHLLESKLALEKISGQKITGLRMPRMRSVDMTEVIKAGYEYDSSINPTWIPGKYNNLHLSRTIYQDQGMTRIPASVSPNLRIPLFWLSFKNFPYSYFKQLTIQTLEKDGYVCLYFHPWEFIDINQLGLPAFTRKLCGEPLLERLDQLIVDLKLKGYEFSTIRNFLSVNNMNNE
jgi:peptidoglycan/xylan/chitin deacetylase (PgdA/CDA1 family)